MEDTVTLLTQRTSLSDKAENSHMPWCQPVLHLAKSDLAAPPCLAGHWVLYRCRIHKQSGIQGNKQLFFPPPLFSCLFNIKGHDARQRLWLEIKPSFSGLFIVKFSFPKWDIVKKWALKTNGFVPFNPDLLQVKFSYETYIGCPKSCLK